ncbi:DNA/RNA nuclease SfsA [Rubrimonas cliftonensis]|uniref:Sugar fermentation stimulation protein homolog n=1 Tax=Rubrimonas cliftonensis TaxID=89524 RepID=A0A1H3YJN2_9RHOB|nr:DNA/RNA nuclease SfsA [Rubrimonas cliftonensis]SEA11128.1 sugar fermentation stimulation protein A [Rubrimonas cliftonensis]
MEFAKPLVRGRLIRRYNRFLANVALDSGGEVVAHCPNPGSMMGLNTPGLPVWLEPNDDPRRKLRYGWRLCELPGGHWAGIDTATPNRAAGEALRAGLIPEFAAYRGVRAEVTYGDRSRVDFLLTEPGLPDAWVEVKNVHLRREGDLAEFPDSVTLRGAKHLRELAAMKAQGARAAMLYVIQRDDCARLAMAADLDPGYAAAFRAARAAGVEAIAWVCAISPEGVRLDHPAPVME